MYTNSSFDADGNSLNSKVLEEKIEMVETGAAESNPGQMLPEDQRITFTWRNISVSTRSQRSSKLCGLISTGVIPPKKLLKNVSGVVHPGELLAIMGASGAGKSTLLNTLLFRNLGDLKVTGDRVANKTVVSPNSLTALSGYVQQDDLFIGTLTVKEHLMFQAMVRMEKSLPMEQRLKRVNEVMKELGLTKSMDTLIGIQGRIKGISGGEMKRLSVASEVLTNPPLLFCDEPTSGLDSFMAASVMDMLGDLAKEGRTVICTIHQPSSQIFSKIDQLLLLAEGELAYLGPARMAKSFFENCGYHCPDDYNPCDYFIEVLAVQPGIETECRENIGKVCNAYKQSKEGQAMEMEVHQTQKENAGERPDKPSPYKASWIKQFTALTWRGWLSSLKEPLTTTVRIIQALFLSIILGIIYYRPDPELNQAEVMNLNGAIFILLTNVSFANIFPVVNVFCAELPIMLREHFNGMYRVDVYFLTKQLVEIPITVFTPIVFTAIFYFCVGLDRTAEKFIIAVAIILILAQVVISLGYFLSCLAPRVEIALAFGPLILLPMMLFGGFYINSESVPVWLIWLKYISWFYYGFEALMVNQWEGVTGICGNPTPTNPNPGCFITGDNILTEFGFKPENFVLDIVILVVEIVVLRIMAYLALLYKARRKSN